METPEIVGDLLAGKVYKAFGTLHPDAGLALLEPNMILTMAGSMGMKPSTYFPLYGASESDIADVKEQFKQLVPSLGLHIFDVEPIDGKTCKVDFIHVVNFPALEQVTHRTTIPGILPFTIGEASDNDALLQQFHEWHREMNERFSQPISEHTSITAMSLLKGVLFGYPDRANKDLFHSITHNATNMVLMIMQFTEDYYSPFSANFEIYPNHLRETSIVQYVNKAESILRGFYRNPLSEDMLNRPDYEEAEKRRALIAERENN